MHADLIFKGQADVGPTVKSGQWQAPRGFLNSPRSCLGQLQIVNMQVVGIS